MVEYRRIGLNLELLPGRQTCGKNAVSRLPFVANTFMAPPRLSGGTERKKNTSPPQHLVTHYCDRRASLVHLPPYRHILRYLERPSSIDSSQYSLLGRP